MDRCKLEYMIKNIPLKEAKDLIYEIDPKGVYKFDRDISKFLLNPDTEDVELLVSVGPCHTIYYTVCEFEEDEEQLALYRADMEKERAEIFESYAAQYRKINEICTSNRTYPLFADPTDVSACEKTRLDLVKIVPEELLNRYFGVSSLREYEPPLYRTEE